MTLPTLKPGNDVEYTDEGGHGPIAAKVTQHLSGNRYHVVLFRPKPYPPCGQVEDVELVEVTEPGTIRTGVYTQ